MAIPDYETFMRPILTILSDGKERSVQQLRRQLAMEFQLTESDLRQTLQSGPQSLFQNRVAWSLVYLKKALAVEAPRRAVYCITERGRKLLTDVPGRISSRDLRQFPEMQTFLNTGRADGRTADAALTRNRPETSNLSPESKDDHGVKTPEELMALGHSVITQQLASELLERVKHESPAFFESLVVDLLLALGYGGSREDAAQVVGGTGDEGIDGIIKEDKLGLDTIYVQAKRWESVVDRPELQKFAGALQGKRARKGVFITTSDFTRGAAEYVRTIDTTIILINGNELARLMIEHNVGVSIKQIYSVKHVDQDYFTDE